MVVRAVALAATLLVLSGCDQQDPEPTTTEPAADTFAVRGTVVLAVDVTSGSDGQTCTGDPASKYRDLREGTQVTVSDPDADLVASGVLGPGSRDGRACSFPFTVEDVPVGGLIFTVRVGARSKGLNFRRAEATSLTVKIA